MTKQEILNELERIKDGLQDSDGMGRFGVDGACDDLDNNTTQDTAARDSFWELNDVIAELNTDGLDYGVRSVH